MKAWQNPTGIIRDVAQGDPVKNYHPDVAAFYVTEVPDGIVNGATRVAGVWTNPPPPPPPVPPTAAEIAAVAAAALAVVKTDLSKQIDAAVLAVYSKPNGFAEEYKAREKAAADYKAAGYPVTVPEWISDFATPAGLTATAATDLILSQAAQIRGALQPLGKLRMQKNAVQRATTEVAARAIHATAMAQIAVIATSLI